MPTYRTSYCGDLRAEHDGTRQTLTGWAAKRRDHGGCIFIDLRDRTGVVQLVLDPAIDENAHEEAAKVRSEYVLKIEGLTRRRLEGAVNPKLATGEIEIAVDNLEILNEAETPPFAIDEDANVDPDTRLQYRYLDMRMPRAARNMLLRHQASQVIRRHFDELGFLEIETPFLTKSTPEGARDFLVPSRLQAGHFYALPQSPQLFKQLLMVGGIDRYFQIVRCFRDESARANRQLEFTQIDVEMSFATQEDIFETVESLMAKLWRLIDVEIQTPFRRMPYAEAMANYGSDKPDLRYGMPLVDIAPEAESSEFRVFRSVLESGGMTKGLRAEGAGSFSRREIDQLTAFVNQRGAKGLAWMRCVDGKLESPIARFFSQENLDSLARRMEAQDGDLLLFVADQPKVVHQALGDLRAELAKRLDLADPKRYEFVWIVDFPLVEWNDDEHRWNPLHHPFTSPHPDDLHFLDKDPSKARSLQHDLAINGQEVWGGSIRIHQREVQERIFDLLQISEEEQRVKFGFLLDALKYGAPPHGGIASGLDRIMMLLTGESSIREVIPFPKTQAGVSPLTGAPTPVDPEQLDEVHIQTIEDE